jgi:hypothetical protein
VRPDSTSLPIISMAAVISFVSVIEKIPYAAQFSLTKQ